MAERIVIASDALTAEIAPFGAELQSLRDAQGRDYMSDGDASFWRGRAPLLFPIVGRLNGDSYALDGEHFAMPKHGFARTSPFVPIVTEAARAVFRLTDTAQTRAAYPFAFALDAEFKLEASTLTMRVTIANTGEVPLPASFGFHPAFAWPLPGGAERADHRIEFERDEPAMLRAITQGGLIGHTAKPSPVVGRGFALTDALFANDALVWTELASRRLRYGVPGAASLDIAFPDTTMLGIWTKSGARFVCIEPWAGHADPAGYDGDFRVKPGVFTVAPGMARHFAMTVTVHPR